MLPGPPSPGDLVRLAASGARDLTPAELSRVLAHVAAAGFDPHARERAGGRLAGLDWRGRTLRGRDRLPPAEVHYLRHVVARREWPPGTTLDQYLDSLRQTVRDAVSGVLVCRYVGLWHLTVVGPSGARRGPAGAPWILLDYRVVLGRWVTGFQPEGGLAIIESERRTNLRWLRQPT